MSRKIRKIALTSVVTVIAVLIVIWITSLIKCEIITKQHYDEFSQAYRQNTMINQAEIDFFKVLDCSENSAKVYYASRDSFGCVLNFEKSGDEWLQSSWSTVWSSTGSASGAVFPYWWHFIYGGL